MHSQGNETVEYDIISAYPSIIAKMPCEPPFIIMGKETSQGQDMKLVYNSVYGKLA